jgi:hypothetical protein
MMDQPLNNTPIPDDLAELLKAYLDDQDRRRGPWQTLRGAPQPEPPFPAHGNPMLAFLFAQFEQRYHAGENLEDAVVDAIVHAWYEGHIEGYDHGQRQARAIYGRRN